MSGSQRQKRLNTEKRAVLERMLGKLLQAYTTRRTLILLPGMGKFCYISWGPRGQLCYPDIRSNEGVIANNSEKKWVHGVDCQLSYCCC